MIDPFLCGMESRIILYGTTYFSRKRYMKNLWNERVEITSFKNKLISHLLALESVSLETRWTPFLFWINNWLALFLFIFCNGFNLAYSTVLITTCHFRQISTLNIVELLRSCQYTSSYRRYSFCVAFSRVTG